MHVMDLTTYYPPHVGGVEAYACAFHEHLLSRNPSDRVTVLTSDLASHAGRSLQFDGRKLVLRYRAIEPITSFALPRQSLRAILRRSMIDPPDVVLSHTRFYPASWCAGRIARRFGARWIHIEHGSGPVQSGGGGARRVSNLYDQTLGKQVLRQADQVIAVSMAAQAFVSSLAGRDAVVMRRGITPPADPWTPPQDGSRPTVLYVGRLVDGKGIFDLIEALSSMQVRLVVVGDGPERARIIQRANELGVRVELAGTLPSESVMEMMRKSDVFVNPSHSEGLPTTVLEAASLGMPIIATDVGGSNEIIVHTRSGLLVPPRRVDRLREALCDVLADKAFAASLGTVARDATRTGFSWNGLEAVIREWAGSNVGRSPS
jgi:colanic acid/amylovoran biosynthesis glycosyltransferase